MLKKKVSCVECRLNSHCPGTDYCPFLSKSFKKEIRKTIAKANKKGN